jgi:DNA-binding FrmR family transcriptional regulator
MSNRLLSPKEHSAIVGRLKTAAGHLRAVIAMVETGEPCDEVLHQLGAVQAALVAAGGAIVDCHPALAGESSVEIILRNPSTEARVAELERLVTLYGLLSKHSVLLMEVPNGRNTQERTRAAR